MARLIGSITKIWNWVSGSSGERSDWKLDNYNLRHQCLDFIPVFGTMVPVDTPCNKNTWDYRRPH